MKDYTEQTESGQKYALAYAMKDLHAALNLYKDVITVFPDSREAEYSKSQINNIAKAVVPEQMLFNTQLDLALTQFEQEINKLLQSKSKSKPEPVMTVPQ